MNGPTPSPTATDDQLALEGRAAARVTLIGMVLDIALGILKCLGGMLFHSHALTVDGIHSLSDAASDLLVVGVMKASRRGPDQTHPYGHQRFETLGTMLLGAGLIAVGAALAWENLQTLIHDEPAKIPQWPVLAAALLSIASKEWIYRYTRHVGEAIRSQLIIANAWHSRTDAFSSVIVLVSTLGAMAGYVWLDALAAVIIAGIVAHIGWSFTWNSVKELVDTGIPESEIDRLKEIARTTEGVRNVHDLRSRKMGGNVLLDVHLVVTPDVSVSEGHQIGMHVVERMRETLSDITSINFHIDAENDEQGTPTSIRLPSRSEIRDELQAHLGDGLKHGKLRLHYLRNKVHIELFLDGSASDGDKPVGQLNRELGRHDWFGSLRIWYSQ